MAVFTTWGPFCECPHNQSPTICDLHQGPLVLETPKSLITHELRTDAEATWTLLITTYKILYVGSQGSGDPEDWVAVKEPKIHDQNVIL